MPKIREQSFHGVRIGKVLRFTKAEMATLRKASAILSEAKNLLEEELGIDEASTADEDLVSAAFYLEDALLPGFWETPLERLIPTE